MLGLRVQTKAAMGAYLSTFASCIPTILYATLLAGQYRTPAIHCEVTAVFTNTAPVDAYRGAGRPEATYVVERLVETAAKELQIPQAEIRRRNFIREFPYQTPVALLYDTGDYDACLDGAIQLADVAGFEARKAEAAKKGKLRGLGYSSYIEACGIAPFERRGSARRPRRPLRGGRGARASDRQGLRLHRLAQPWPGARDHVRAGRRGTPRHSHRRHRHRPRRHRADSRSAWAPTVHARSRSAARRS
jgi:CO/xanthine dehydrogenase Mo-binding subunit